jgi:tetratricopeptide (TPR) repeat protein/ribosomal protein S27AE
MLQGKCEQCGATNSLALFKGVDGRLLCGRCTQQVVEQAKAKRTAVQIVSIIDPTVCYQCKADNGSTELPLIGGLPFCVRCAPGLYERPFPPWLKLTLAGLLVLLGLGLVHSVPFFRAGKALVIGERLVVARQYQQAIPQLQTALAIAPDCEKAVLLLGKADLLTGRYQEANKVLTGHKGGQFKEGPLATEVRRTFERVDKGLGKAADARKLFEAGKSVEAARTYHEAAALLPEAPGLADAVDGLDAVAAFDQKDYDTFLAIAEKGWKTHSQSSDYAGALASALACKYAVTGDPAFRARCEEMLEKAGLLAASSPEAIQRNKEYEERTRYRLRTRKILDPKEYDRQFHPEKSKPVK